MTHFTVGLIVPTRELPHIEEFVAQQMAPYDESMEVEPYVSYSIEQAQADLTRDISRFERIIELKDADYNLEKCQEHLEKLRFTTAEEKYRDYLRYHEQFDEDGNPISTYNPDSKWDWYVIGGRWDGWINDRKTSHEAMSDNIATTEAVLERNKLPHAIITPDGELHEHGQMGWWGNMLTENESYESEAKLVLSRFPGHHLIILDAHI
jgi:DNA-binding transcriptional MerR regulator